MASTALAVLLAAAVPLPATARADLFATPSDGCDAPPALGRPKVVLPKTHPALTGGRPLKIVTLGSSSTAGAGASAARFSYPSRLAVELAQRYPTATIEMVNRG